MRVRYSTHHAREPLVLQRGMIASNFYHYYTLLSINYVIIIFLCTPSRRETEFKTILSSYFHDLEQEGFRRFHSTIHALLRLVQDLFNGYNKKEMSLVTFIDMEKAFDSIWRDGLLTSEDAQTRY